MRGCEPAATSAPRPPRRRSPLWDQEDVFQRDGCAALTVVAMPFYWPPRPDAVLDGHPLPVPAHAAHHPTFGALSLAAEAAVPTKWVQH